MAQLLSGKKVAEALTAEIKHGVEVLKSKGITPTLGIIRVGENAPDISYEKGAMKRCEEVGIAAKNYILSKDVTQSVLIDIIKNANGDKSIHGILLLRPLPKHIDDNIVRNIMLPQKDVDGITDSSMADLYGGINQAYAPCTAESVIKILDYYRIGVTGKRIAVIGRSVVIGKPVSLLLLGKDATVTICHSKTRALQEITKSADMVIVAVGKAESFGAEYFSQGQVVIDVGVNARTDGGKGICGDVCFSEVEPIVSAITPVPGGVGSVTNCVLLNHIIKSAEGCV